MRTRLVSLLLTLSCGLAPSLFADETLPPHAKLTRRWAYRGTIDERPVALTLIETGRRVLDDAQLVHLAVEVNARRIEDADLSALGLDSSPFRVFAAEWTLRLGKGDGCLFEEPAGDTLARAGPCGGATRLRWSDRRKRAPASTSEDRDSEYHYGTTVGRWASVCEVFEHPSPDTGDFYRVERCFAPGVGITLLDYSSVWGSYRFELVTPPSAPALAQP